MADRHQDPALGEFAVRLHESVAAHYVDDAVHRSVELSGRPDHLVGTQFP
ncbi:hypothetical protein [Micromonospora carbonacea]|nr:hypothetical protein [Micromonospora carbonacea]